MRPLEALPFPHFQVGGNIADIIANIPGTPEYNTLQKYFDDYPEKSYMSRQCRALIYPMVRLLRPQRIIEIGTLFAGTAEIFARALWANGEGKLTTIDPFGADRVPGILETWPAELRRHVDFQPINSMQLFAEMAERQEQPDFIFVDGNHEYEFALFDLLSSARNVRPGGIVFMDNYCDPGVALAVHRFLAQNPMWQPVDFAAHPAFGTNTENLLLNGLYRILIAPSAILLGSEPRSFHWNNLDAEGVEGFTLDFGKPTAGGRIFYKAYLRTIPWEFHLGKGEMEETIQSGVVPISPGANGMHIKSLAPLVSAQPRSGFSRRCELALVFESAESGEVLSLARTPVPDFTNGDSTGPGQPLPGGKVGAVPRA